MGLTTVSLSQEALDKMRALWAKAKEAVQLQALVDNLKESELQLAQQEAAENERHVDLLVGVHVRSPCDCNSLPCPFACKQHAAPCITYHIITRCLRLRLCTRVPKVSYRKH